MSSLQQFLRILFLCVYFLALPNCTPYHFPTVSWSMFSLILENPNQHMTAAPSPKFRRYPIMTWYDAPIPGICMQVTGRQRPCQNFDGIVGGGGRRTLAAAARTLVNHPLAGDMMSSSLLLRSKRPIPICESG